MKFYRCNYVQTSSFAYELTYDVYDMVKETPKGYWIIFNQFKDFNDIKKLQRFILKNSKKKYAYPTKQEALRNFIIRKKSYMKNLEANLDLTKILFKISLTQYNNLYGEDKIINDYINKKDKIFYDY